MKTFLSLAFLILTVSASSAAEEVEIDFDKTKAACDNGSGKSCFMIGVMYQHGLGVDKDTEKAIVYFKIACDLDIPASCGVLKNLN